MEIDILTTLQWLLNPPLPQDFAYLYILQLSKYTKSPPNFANVLLEVSNYVIEVMVQFTALRYERPSVIACATILVSFQGLKSNIMDSQEDAKLCFLKMVESLLGTNYSSRTIEKILSVENEMKKVLSRMYDSNFKNIFHNFDPERLVYDLCDDPPSLL